MRPNYFIFIIAISLLPCLTSSEINAQDLLAGDITITYISGNKYDATVTIYARDTSINRIQFFLNGVMELRIHYLKVRM